MIENFKNPRWVFALFFLCPFLLLAVFAVLISKAMIITGEMLIDAGNWLYDLRWPWAQEKLTRLKYWIFDK